MLVKFNILVETDAVEPWRSEPLQTRIDTATVTYEDGRAETIKVEPYVVTRKLPSNVETMWTREELLAYGLLRVVPATLPDGKQFVGEVRYVRDGDVAREVREVEDLPPSPDTVTITVDEHEKLVADAEKWRLRDVAPTPATEEKT